jgi:hypothetical protein
MELLVLIVVGLIIWGYVAKRPQSKERPPAVTAPGRTANIAPPRVRDLTAPAPATTQPTGAAASQGLK